MQREAQHSPHNAGYDQFIQGIHSAATVSGGGGYGYSSGGNGQGSPLKYEFGGGGGEMLPVMREGSRY